jgi:hypothetical protein
MRKKQEKREEKVETNGDKKNKIEKKRTSQ